MQYTPIGAVAKGITGAFNTFKDKKTAAKIAGTDEKNLSTAQRLGASAASYASALTFGLVKPETMYKAGKTAMKFLKYTPHGAALNAVGKAFNTFKDKKTAAKIAGTDEKNLSATQRLGASAASAASALTFGLIKPETMYKAGKTAMKFLKYTPHGAALNAAGKALDTFTNKKAAAKIAGADEKKLTAAQRVGASAASAASAMTFGLVKPETMYKGIRAVGNIAAKISPLRRCF
jgi:hypothetical protein